MPSLGRRQGGGRMDLLSSVRRVLLLAGCAVLASAAAPGESVRLEYGARKLLMKAEATVAWSQPRPEVALADGIVLSVRSRSPTERSTVELTLRPDTGAAIEKVQRYADGTERRYRFLESGVQYDRIGPTRRERGQPRETWTSRHDEFLEAPDLFDQSAVVAPSALFYLLPSLELDSVGDRVELPVFSKRQFVRLVLEVVSLPVVDVDWMLEQSTGSERRRTQQKTVHVRARLADSAGEGVGLLGLQGELDFFLDPDTGIPLLIGGRVPYLGRVLIKLRRARLN